MFRCIHISFRITGYILFLGIFSPAIAQDFSGHNWYFGGSSQAIRFSRSNNTANLFSPKAALSTGGSAVVSNAATSNLSFYTDGVQVYDATNQVMSGGPLTGDPTRNQGVVVCKVPGQSTQYYIFHSDNTGTIRATIVDMSLAGNAAAGQPPLGQILGSNAATPIPGAQSEAMIIIPHANGEDFWLITHTTGTTNYNITSITASGIALFATVSPGGSLILDAANFSYHPATGQIAVAPDEANRNVEVMTFTNGAAPSFSNNRPIFNSSSPSSGIFDTEWSNSGQYLYVSSIGANGAPPGDVKQFDMTDINGVTIPMSILPAGVFNSYGLQLAPDSAIYHLYETSAGVFRLGKLTDIDTVASQTNYTPTAFTTNPDFDGRQFPSFAPDDSVAITVSFTSQGTCTNSPISFFPSVSPAADSLVWNFGDGQRSSEWSPIHTYESGGQNPVTVRLTAFLNGDSASVTQTINLTQFDLQISVVQDTTACSCELGTAKNTTPPSPPPSNPCTRFTIDAQINGTGSPTWTWFISGDVVSTGSGTTATLQPDSAGYYYLVATVGGCSTYAGVNIREYGLQDARANIWYFGKNAGIDFNPLPAAPLIPVAKPVSNPVMDAPEGTATISDANGQVIFFTDGENVWNDQFQLVTPSAGGDQGSAQSSLIIPVPGDETIYYIFTTQEVYSQAYELRYSLYDAKTKSVVGPSQVLFARSTERITGNENWLIAHEYGNNSFRAYRITAEGISNPVITSIGSDHSYVYAENGQGYMKLGPGNMLAVALATPGVSNVVEVFDFIDSTGVVTNFRTANLNNTNGQVYGVEFSPDGTNLYATLSAFTSQLYEFAIDTLGNITMKAPPEPPVNAELGAIQTGPDGQIYVAVNGANSLGVIQPNPLPTQRSTFNLNGFPTTAPPAGWESNLGLPNFAQNIGTPAQGPGLSITGFCNGDSTIFTGMATNNIDTLTYMFGDGNFVRGVNLTTVSHLYATVTVPTDYYVELRITNRCEGFVTAVRDTITIYPPPPAFTRFETICQPPQILDPYNPIFSAGFVPPTTYAYAWSTGDSTRTISVSTPADYSVTVTDTVTGCFRPGTITATPAFPLDLGPDSTVCSSPASKMLDTRINTGTDHSWTLNGTPIAGNTTGQQPAAFTSPGPFTYIVRYAPPNPQGCFATDTVTFRVNQSPVVSLTGTPFSDCTPPNGQLTATIDPFPTPTLTYIAFGVNLGFTETRSNEASGVKTIPIPASLPPDTYQIIVSDQITGCTTSSAPHIINPTGMTVTPTSKQICGPSTIDVTTSFINGGTYTVRNASTLQAIFQGTKPAGVTNFTTDINNLLPVGNYVIEVDIGAGCMASGPVSLTQSAQVVVAFDMSNLCNASQVSANPLAGLDFDWSLSSAGSISSPMTAGTVTVNPGIWTLRLRASDPSATLCADTITRVVMIDNFTPDFQVGDPCISNAVVLTATQPVGTDYFYRWMLNGVQVNSGSPVSVTSPGNYVMEVQNPFTGCPYKASQSKPVPIEGPLTVIIERVEIPCTNASAINFQAVTTPPDRTINSYEWSFNGAVVANQTSSTFTVNRGNGTYAVTVRTDNCVANAIDNNRFAEPTPGLLPETVFICPDPDNPDENTREVTLYPGDFITYSWSTGQPDSTITVSTIGDVFVTLENEFGCFSTDDTKLIENCEPRITGPNAFRPASGLAANKEFYLFTRYILEDEFQVFIFNRWGEMVYQSADIAFRWNGGYNNNAAQPLPPGTYSFVVKFKSIYVEEGTQEHRGGVVLLR